MKEDFLKELGNIGIGNAATSLSKMINSKVGISLPMLDVIPLKQMTNTDKSVCAVIMGIAGDAKGALVTIFQDKASFWLIDKISKNPMGTTSSYDEMGKSFMKEFTNIIGGTFITSLSNLLHSNLLPQPPSLFIGKGNEIEKEFDTSLKKIAENVLYVRTDIIVNEEKIEGEIYLVLDQGSFDNMLKKMT